MIDPTRMIFIHGLEGNSQGVKAVLLRGLFPGILTPDFPGTLQERMASLYRILGDKTDWTIIGSSFGGLMAALFTCQHPSQVRKQILLAPALVLPEFAGQHFPPIDVPTIVYHSFRDEIVPMEPVRALAEKTFSRLKFHVVDDDHGLYQTVHQINWQELIETEGL